MAIHDGVSDTGTPYEIVPLTRSVAIAPGNEIVGTVGDGQSERVTFRIPRYYDGHDLSACDQIWINWKNAGGTEGTYLVEDRETEGEMLAFSWLLSAAACSTEGVLAFSIHFADLGSDGEILYRWSTRRIDRMVVAPTLSGGSGDYAPEHITVDVNALLSAVEEKVKGVYENGSASY